MHRSGPSHSKCLNPGELSCQEQTSRMNCFRADSADSVAADRRVPLMPVSRWWASKHWSAAMASLTGPGARQGLASRGTLREPASRWRLWPRIGAEALHAALAAHVAGYSAEGVGSGLGVDFRLRFAFLFPNCCRVAGVRVFHRFALEVGRILCAICAGRILRLVLATGGNLMFLNVYGPTNMVGAVRFELTTSCTPSKRATKLRYAPTSCAESCGSAKDGY